MSPPLPRLRILRARPQASLGVALAVALAPTAPLWAQDTEPTPDAGAAAEPPPPEPSFGLPPALETPMPRVDQDFTMDRELFRVIETDPELERRREANRESRPARSALAPHEQAPVLTYLTQAVAGVFGAGAVGLLGARVGEAIDPGDDRLALGGPHGPAFGALAGTMVGAWLGVWGASALFDKDTHPGWIALGAGAGTALGAGAALGVAAGLERGDGTAALAIGALLVLQVGSAILFTDLFLPGSSRPDARPPEPPRARIDDESRVSPSSGQAPRSALSVPVISATF